MRLTALFFLVGMLSVGAEGIGQTITLSAENISLPQLFKDIKRQTGYNFLYFDNDMRKAKRISIHVKDASLDQVLKKCLANQPLTYYITDKTIVLSPQKKPVPNGDDPADMSVRWVDIKGRIMNKAGEPVVAASIILKNSRKGTQSDLKGYFSLSGINNNETLIISCVGYETTEIKVKLNGVGGYELTPTKNAAVTKNIHGGYDILLPISNNSMDEILVVPYGTQSKSSYTGSATTVKSEKLEDRSRTSFQQSLQGNVPGLQVMDFTGQPGASPVVRIRGISSFSGINEPLYVVDGIPMLTQEITTLATSSNSGAGINPNDIESVTVLRDASAASIYGSRGANGVILITTKKGAAGKTKINLSANYGVNKMTVTKRNQPLSTTEMTSLLIEGVINSNRNAAESAITTSDAAYQYLVDHGLDPNVSTNWMDWITQTGQYQQYNISASGGNANTNFYLSGGYYKQDAVTKGQWFDRKTAKFTLNHKASDKLSFNSSLGFTAQGLSTISNAGSGANPVRSLYRLVPWVAPYTDDGTYNTLLTYNPEVVLHENKYETNIYQAIGNVGAKLRFTNYLSFESKLGIDFHYSDDYRYWSPLWVDGSGTNGRGAEYGTMWNNWTVSNILKFEKQVSDFNVVATLGQEGNRRNLKRVSTQATNFAADGLYTLSSAADPQIAWSYKAASTLASYFLNANINYKQKYYLNLTGRRDGSSRFGALVRWANFWSVGGAWNLEKEKFLQNITWIDHLKLRASYGLSGNQLGDYYGAQGYLVGGNNYMNDPGFLIAQIESGRLTWEENRPLDIGLEWEMFKNRLSLSAGWYTRRTEKLIQDMPVPMENGVSSLTYNTGAMKNYGWEFSIDASLIQSKHVDGFNWKAAFNISTQKNKILEYQNSPKAESYYMREVGGDYYQFYLRGYAGVDPQTGEALWYKDASESATTNVYNEASPYKQKGKSALADFFGGFTNTFTYKRVSLSAQFYFNWGGYIYDIWGQYTHSDGSAGLSQTGMMSRMVYENHWKQPGDMAEYPKITYYGTQTGLTGQSSTRFLYDGSYLRLRDITISYDLPSLHGTVGMVLKGARIYLRANNLFTYVKDDLLPYDPEVNISGLLDQNLPISRQYSVGLNLSL